MASGEKPYYLVKFIDKKWADKLMDGDVFMRAIACFGDISRRSADSQNEFRGDILEGINYSFGNQAGLIDVLTYREKIYCLYALEFDEKTGRFIKPDNRILEFGDTAVIIHNTGEFLYRICYAMLDRFGNDFWTSFQRVKYDVDFSVEQPYDEFCKAIQILKNGICYRYFIINNDVKEVFDEGLLSYFRENYEINTEVNY